MGSWGVGMPAALKLGHFAQECYEAFGTTAYLVGSATRTTDWRDVDVRVILDDDEFKRQIGPLTRPKNLNPRWNAFCLAFAARGREVTGLPIDFQIDQQTDANEKHDGIRHALGLEHRIAADDPARSGPDVEFVEGGKVVTHHSLDGRELRKDGKALRPFQGLRGGKA